MEKSDMENAVLFLDESWPNKGASFLCVTIMVCSPEVDRKIKIAVSRTLKNKVNSNSAKKGLVQELKGVNTTLAIKKYFFNSLPLEGLSIFSIVLNMDFTLNLSKDQSLYNNLVRHLLNNIPFSKNLKTFHLIADKCKNNQQIKVFDLAIKSDLEKLLPVGSRIYITHENSIENLTLQAVDMFNWGIFRKYSKNDREWYDFYKSYIKKELYYIGKIETAPLIPIS